MRGLAREAGLSDGVVRQYLSGQTEPSRLALIKLARARGVAVGWLAAGESPRVPTDPHTEAEGLRAVLLELLKACEAMPPELRSAVILCAPEVYAELRDAGFPEGRLPDVLERHLSLLRRGFEAGRLHHGGAV
jgi:transcriptional regulator with XRE-family HTH domain